MAGPYKDKNGPAIPGVTTAAEPMPAGPPVVDQGVGGPQADSQPAAHPLDSYGIPEQSSPTGPRVSMGDTGFGWAVGANDFHPNGFRPNESRSTGVGKYGGSPIFAATIGMPDGVIASREQANINKQKQLEAALSKLAPEFEDVDNPKYRDEFQRKGNAEYMQLIRDTQQIYGKQRGTELLSTYGTPEYEKRMNLLNSINTIARGANQANKSALAYLAADEKDAIEQNPAMKKSAEDLVYRQGTKANATAKELAESQENFSANANMYDTMMKHKIPDMFKSISNKEDLVSLIKKGDQSGAGGSSLYIPGFQGWLNNKKDVTPSDVVDYVTDYYAEKYKKTRTRDEVKAMVEGFVPKDFEQKFTSKQLRAPKSSGGNSPENEAARYVPDSTTIPEGTVDGAGNPIGGSVNSQGENLSRPTINLMAFSNKQGKTAPPMEYRDGKERVYMHPDRLMNIDGDYYIIGNKTGMPRTRAELIKKADDENWNPDETSSATKGFDDVNNGVDSPEARALTQRFNTLQSVRVPLSENESLLSQSLGIDVSRAKKSLGSNKLVPGSASAPQLGSVPANEAPRGAEGAPIVPSAIGGRKEQQPFVEPTLKEEGFDAAYNKLPPGAYYIGPDGHRYQKQ